MKTTLVIADDLFEKVQEVARREKTTFRALTERGLKLVLEEYRRQANRRLPPLVTVRGHGLRRAFQHATWEQIRDESYRGRGVASASRRPRKQSSQS
jgi:hypothetical protein